MGCSAWSVITVDPMFPSVANDSIPRWLIYQTNTGRSDRGRDDLWSRRRALRSGLCEEIHGVVGCCVLRPSDGWNMRLGSARQTLAMLETWPSRMGVGHTAGN